MGRTRTLALFAAIVSSASASAAETSLVLKVGVDAGGSSIGVIAPNGQQIDRVQLGHGIWLGGGASILNDAKTVQGEITLSYLYSSNYCAGRGCPPQPPNTWGWNRIPLDALVFYRWSRVRLGGGLTYDLYSKLEGSGDASSLNDLDIRSELGARLELDVHVFRALHVGLRYTRQFFRESGSSSRLDGSGIGAVLTLSE
jgi:hypothetical protein